MTLDPTLKHRGGLLRQRSVLTRAERIAKMTEEGKFDPEENSPLGLPKTRVLHSKAGVKSKKVAEEIPGEEGAATESAES